MAPAWCADLGEGANRRLILIGAMSVIRWVNRNGTIPGTRLQAMLLRKPCKLVAIALANKMTQTHQAFEHRAGVIA